MEMVLAKQLKSGISFNLIKQSIKNAEIDSYLKEFRESNQNYNARIENIRLKNLVEILKKENIEETNINELNNANKSYYKMSNDSFNEIINLLADFTKLSKDNAEKTIEKEFKDYVVRKRK